MMSLGEAAKQLGCTTSGVRKLVAKREIKYFQHGKKGRIKFLPEWIDEYIELNTIPPKNDNPRCQN
jgi:excisionase family DNA binding protein